MAAAKKAQLKDVRVVKYFEDRDENGKKVTFSPSDKAIQIDDEKLREEALEAGLVVEIDSEDAESEDGGAEE
ncbi:MAG: hypothetical protein OIF55_14655 [Amphritea sp.]|nr:hypothetical protein [Amphritea sp.]